MDITWNGTHYFLADTAVNTIYILSNYFWTLAQFTVPFDPLGIAVVGKYLYISQETSPNNLYKYTTRGSLVATYPVAHFYGALEYDGAKLWASDNESSICQIDLSDGHLIASYNTNVSTGYAGLVFDSRNNVFWAVDWAGWKICQLDSSTFAKTGVQVATPTFFGQYGLEFDGKSLIMTAWSTAAIYKIIIGFPSGSGIIPGFTDMVLLLSLITLISIWFLLRQARPHRRQI